MHNSWLSQHEKPCEGVYYTPNSVVQAAQYIESLQKQLKEVKSKCKRTLDSANAKIEEFEDEIKILSEMQDEKEAMIIQMQNEVAK